MRFNQKFEEELKIDLDIKFLAVRNFGFEMDTGIHVRYQNRMYYVSTYTDICGYLMVTLVDLTYGEEYILSGEGLERMVFIQKYSGHEFDD